MQNQSASKEKCVSVKENVEDNSVFASLFFCFTSCCGIYKSDVEVRTANYFKGIVISKKQIDVKVGLSDEFVEKEKLIESKYILSP